MTDRGRWASPAHPLVGRRAGLECQRMPRGPAESARRCVMGRLLLGVRKQKSKALPSAPPGISTICPASERCRTAGCERGWCRAGCHATPGDRKPSVAITGRTTPEDKASASLRVQAERLRLRENDCRAVKHLSTQIVRKTGESNFISNDASHCSVAVNAFQQYEWLASLATAK